MAVPLRNTYFTQAFYQEIPDAYWRLGDAVGASVAAEQSFAGYSASVIGGVTFGQAGWAGDGDGAALLNGTTGYLNAGNVSAVAYGQRPFSVVASFKTTSSAFMAIVGKCVSTTKAGWGLALDTGKVRFFAYDSSGVSVFDASSAGTYHDGNWHHIVAWYNLVGTVGALVTVFIDGGSVLTSPPSGVPDSNSARLTIGAFDNAGSGASFFNGTLDEVSLYPYAFQITGQSGKFFNARNTLTNDKSLTQARAGLMRSFGIRSFYYTSRNIVTLNGTTVTAKIWKNTLKTKEILNEQPDTAQLTLFDKSGALNPSVGNVVIMADGAVDNRYFGGTVVRARRRSTKMPGGTSDAIPRWDLQLTDWTWLLNRRIVAKNYPTGTLAHVAFIDVVTNNTTGFTTKNVKTSSPALTGPLALKGVKVAAALSRIASAVNWGWYPDPNCDLHFSAGESMQRPKSIVPGNYTYDSLDYTLDLTQIRTRAIGEGGGSVTTAPIAVGATAIAVEECGWYIGAGGSVASPEGDIITYTGISATSGPGNLTGVPASGAGSVTQAIKQGEVLDIWIVRNDTAAQTALGLLEHDQNNSATDGIHEQYLALSNASVATVTQALDAELVAYKNINVTGTLWSRDRLMRTGKVITIKLPVRGIAVDVTVQQVQRSLLTVDTFQFDVTFATTWRNFVDVLKRVTRVA